jgi:hypothetical protein
VRLPARCLTRFEVDHAAERAHREFSRVPRPELTEPWPEETAAAFGLLMREYHTMHARLTAEVPKAA